MPVLTGSTTLPMPFGTCSGCCSSCRPVGPVVGLAMRSPHLAGHRAKFFRPACSPCCPVSAQLLRTASLTEAALALGVGAIARSARTGRGYDLIDECGAVLVARNNPNDFGD